MFCINSFSIMNYSVFRCQVCDKMEKSSRPVYEDHSKEEKSGQAASS
jgi:hypothetical protein